MVSLFDGANFQFAVALDHLAPVILGITEIIPFNGPGQVQKVVFHPAVFIFELGRPGTSGHFTRLEGIGQGRSRNRGNLLGFLKVIVRFHDGPADIGDLDCLFQDPPGR